MDWLGAGLALAGGLLGSDSGDSTQTAERKMDPRMDRFVYGLDGQSGLLGSASNLLQQQMRTGGMNDLQRQGLDMQRQFLMSPQYMQGFNSMMGVGQGLMGAGIAGNPFTTGQMRPPVMGGQSSGSQQATQYQPFNYQSDFGSMVKDAYGTLNRSGFGNESHAQIDPDGYNWWVSQLASGAVSPADFEKKFYGAVDSDLASNPDGSYADFLSGVNYNGQRGNSGAWQGLGAQLPNYSNLTPSFNTAPVQSTTGGLFSSIGGGSGNGQVGGGGNGSSGLGQGISSSTISAALSAMAASENPALRAVAPTMALALGLGGRALADGQINGISNSFGALGDIAGLGVPGIGSFSDLNGNVMSISTPDMISAADRAMFGDSRGSNGGFGGFGGVNGSAANTGPGSGFGGGFNGGALA